MTERQHICERAVVAMSSLLGHYAASGCVDRAIEVALRLLLLDPLQEKIHRSLYARQGRQASARRQLHLCRELLRRELDVAPEPERLFQEIRGQRRCLTLKPSMSEGLSVGPLNWADPCLALFRLPGDSLRRPTRLPRERPPRCSKTSCPSARWRRSGRARRVLPA
ncbi:bacterial transcriptional activator domain-containing protein [Mesorhizobium silamurunense]|uniref:bacterial transcriptional activator domain-containing protein n=1 Tax=Mesorhizobium silamurunense TaxID=499528 RepID=UPI00177B3971